MTLNPETLAALRAAFLVGAAVFAIAKISRQCSAEGLRNRLRAEETALFEFARLGHIGFQHPAYLLLRDSLRSIIWASHDFSLTRATLAAMRGHDIWRSANLQRDESAWEEALSQIADRQTREAIAETHRRMMRTVMGYVALGAVPFAAWLHRRVRHVLAELKRRPLARRRGRLVKAHVYAMTGLPTH